MSQERYWEQWDPVATSMDAYWADTPVEDWYRKTVAGILVPFIKRGRTYLDIGCGSGLLLNELVAAGVNPDSIIGIDNSQNMIALARKRVPHGTVGLGDLFGLAYPSNSIDVVGGLNILSHIPDMRDGLKEMWRVSSWAVFFTAIIGDQASTLNDFWGASKFIRNTFRVEDVQNIVREVCGKNAILINARSFPHQRMALFAVFKPNTAEPAHARHTVILGSFNRPKMIKRAIRSVLEQTVTDWQLIIADDGSNDDTIRSIHEEVGGDPRVILNPCTDPCLEPVRKGASSRACMRINDALKLVRGEIIHYLADDDWYNTQRFSVFDQIFSDPAVHCGYGRVILMNMDKPHGSIFPKSPCTQPLSNLDHNQVAHRAETFKVISQWPTEEKGDYALEGHYFTMLAKNWPFIGLDKIVAYKSYHPFNMQKTRDQSTSVREL